MMNTRVGNRKIYHNLPHPDYVEFIGRKQELAELQRLLAPHNRAWVIVIDGIGGIGKSALALEAAYRYLPPTMRRGRGHADETLNLPPDLYAQVKQTLLQCHPFVDVSALLALFVDARISQWRTAIPTTVATLEQRVLAVIGALYDGYNAVGDNALALLLHVLRDHFSPQDAQYQHLTTLAEAVAQVLQHADTVVSAPDTADEGFEAIVWVSAKNTVLTADGITRRASIFRALDDIYTAIAVALEYEAITRARQEEQDEVVRRALTRQRTLLIVDNLETVDDERVLAFLRELPPPTKAIVTTRHRIDVAYPIRLSGMPEEDGLALIAHEAEKKGVTLTAEQSDLLFRRTGGIPLAIVWSVAQMGYGYGVEAVLRKLGEPAGDVTRFIFEAALERIHGKPAYTLLLALSLFATDASREALGYVADLPELDRDEGLVELEKLSLVNREGGRFSMMAMTKEQARLKLLENQSLENFLRARWSEYLYTLLKNLREIQYDGIEAFKWDTNNIIAYLSWLWGVGDYLGFIEASFLAEFFFWATGDWRVWLSILQQGRNASMLQENVKAQADFSYNLGLAYMFQGNMAQAKIFAEESERLFQQLSNEIYYGLSMIRVGEVLAELEDYETAEEKLCKALDILMNTKQGRYIARAYRSLGLVALKKGELSLARQHLENACALRESEISSSGGLVITYRTLGKVALAEGNFLEAQRHFNHSLEMAQNLHILKDFADAKFRLALVAEQLGNTGDALSLGNESLEVFTRLGMQEYKMAAEEFLRRLS